MVSGSLVLMEWLQPRFRWLGGVEQGNLSNVQWFHGIGEYRIDWGPGLRIYLAKDGVRIILLLGGGTKKRQQRDIDLAVERWEDYKRRKADKG